MPLRCGDIEISDAERKPCEVWTRIMGYYRRVEDANIGKRQEHRDRKFFTVPKVIGGKNG